MAAGLENTIPSFYALPVLFCCSHIVAGHGSCVGDVLEESQVQAVKDASSRTGA
jgi:hypothetical protein